MTYQDDNTYSEAELDDLWGYASDLANVSRRARRSIALEKAAIVVAYFIGAVDAIGVGYHLSMGNGSTALWFGLLAAVMAWSITESRERVTHMQEMITNNDACFDDVMFLIGQDHAYREGMASAGPFEDDDPIDDEITGDRG